MNKVKHTCASDGVNAVSKLPLFALGTICATPGALACLEQCGVSAATLVRRHQCGDWGDLSCEDKKHNADSVAHGLRVLSSYPMCNGQRLWVITEWDRSVTTLLLPSEY